MAKFPTEVERSITVNAPIRKVYSYLWDVVGSSRCVPGIDTCSPCARDTYCFVFEERSTGPVSMIVRYTAHYEGNGKDTITFTGTGADGDNTEIQGGIQLQANGAASTQIVIRQMLAPDTPVPRLLQGMLRSYVESEAASAVQAYLTNVKKAVEA